MDRDAISATTHAGLPFANPLAPDAIDAAIAALELPPRAVVLDVGCGAGEALARVKAHHPEAWTVGIEPAAPFAALARERVDEVHEAPFEDAPLEPGVVQAVLCLASSHALGTWDEALTGLARLVTPGGAGLIGEGFWRRAPSAGYLQALGGATEDELPSRDGLLAGAEAAGWEVVATDDASVADWARYEEGLIANGERALEREDDPDLRRWVDAARARWEHPDGRDTLGFTLLTLRRR
jgi:SAM-dependent methyltransferase